MIGSSFLSRCITLLIFFLSTSFYCHAAQELTSETYNKFEMLFSAFRENDTEQIITFVDTMENVNIQFEGGVTLLYLAAIKNNKAVVKKLLEKGADANIQTEKEAFAPLHIAAMWGHLDIAKLLIDAGADVNIRMQCGDTPLYWTAWKGQKGGFSWRFRSKKDAPEWEQQLEIAKLLLSHDADGSIKNNEGETVVDAAYHYKRSELSDILKEHGFTKTSSKTKFRIIVYVLLILLGSTYLFGRKKKIGPKYQHNFKRTKSILRSTFKAPHIEGKHSVCIFYTGDDHSDVAFCKKLETALSDFACSYGIDVDALRRGDLAGKDRAEKFEGTPIYILSPSMLKNPEFRRNIVMTSQVHSIPTYHPFYICRGISAQDIRDKYPDMEQLFNTMMVGEEVHLPELSVELKEYLGEIPNRFKIKPRVWLLIKLIFANIFYWLGTVAFYMYYVGYFSALYLIITLFQTNGHLQLLLALHASFSAGYYLTRIKLLDIWPWLSPKWIHGLGPLGCHTDAPCSKYDFGILTQRWDVYVFREHTVALIILSFFVIPSMIPLSNSQYGWIGGVVFFSALLIQRLWAFAMQFFTRRAFWQFGMDENYMDYTSRKLSPFGVGVRSEYKKIFREGTKGLVNRNWFKNPVKIFISYARRDEAHTPTAESLHQTITKLGIPCFMDTRKIKGEFIPWRRLIVDEMLDCTHLFVVLGPGIKEAKVIHREIRMALQRWYLEPEPALITVVPEDVARALQKENISQELSFLVNEVPKLTYEQAINQEVIDYIINLCRRQGLWENWYTLFRANKRLQNFIDLEFIENAF